MEDDSIVEDVELVRTINHVYDLLHYLRIVRRTRDVTALGNARDLSFKIRDQLCEMVVSWTKES